jgi:pimeloyl-ACP methyl ester carboxylesterase
VTSEFNAKVFGSTGKLVFFLHGWPDNSSVFADQVDSLSATHRCVLVDNPYSNSSTASVIGPSWNDLYRGFDKLVELHRKKDEKILLVAHDWGTLIALDYERKYGKARVGERLAVCLKLS